MGLKELITRRTAEKVIKFPQLVAREARLRSLVTEQRMAYKVNGRRAVTQIFAQLAQISQEGGLEIEIKAEVPQLSVGKYWLAFSEPEANAYFDVAEYF